MELKGVLNLLLHLIMSMQWEGVVQLAVSYQVPCQGETYNLRGSKTIVKEVREFLKVRLNDSRYKTLNLQFS